MSAARQLRALTASYRTLSARTVCVRTAQPARLAATTLPREARSFSASVQARAAGASDAPLSQRLQEEIKYEKDAAAAVEEGTPEFLKAFKEEQIWSIEEEQGLDEIALTRTFGNEHIRIMFSIADIDTSQPQSQEYANEEEQANEEEELEGPDAASYPVRTSITITKPGGSAGALAVDAICQDGAFSIDNIAFYNDAKLATELTAEADWKRRGLYIGPQFEHLDVNVQDEVEKFLRERGIAEGLALFIPEFSEYKEQKEYVRWLESVKKFIDV